MTPRRSSKQDRITIRPADRGDADALAEFRCSNGPWFENETEKYVNESLPKILASRGDAYDLLVATDDEDRLLGLAGHRTDALEIDDHTIVFLIRLDVVALALDQQGRKLRNGSRLSDALLQALFAHAIDTHDLDAFMAIVATENHNCIAMLERHADWTQVPHGGIEYVRLTARIAMDEGDRR